jgi:hypothetical protein
VFAASPLRTSLILVNTAVSLGGEGKVILMQQSGSVQAGDASTSNISLGPTLILSGGTGYNDLVSATLPSATTYVLPISDNGGSSSEIIRCFGGPSIGDIRSRLVRLIPSEVISNGDATGTGGNEALRNLLSYRLPVDNSEDEILDEWKEVIAGSHQIWEGVDEVRGSIVRGELSRPEERLDRADRLTVIALLQAS